MYGSRTHSYHMLVLVRTYLILSLLLTIGCTREESGTQYYVSIVQNKEEQRVDISVEGDSFASYIYSDKIRMLKKTVLYPILAANGKYITRGFPLEPRAGERVDHPHQIGFWLNYGDVNGLDFWGHSDAIPPERADEMGTIRHREIKRMQNGTASGELEVTVDWLRPDGLPILREDTRFVFRAGSNLRSVDRITTLTAVHERVLFKDSKEGMIAIRVTRALEHPTDTPITVTDVSGKATAVPVLDNEGVTGKYLSSEGITGIDVWGTRARWVVLSGIVEGDSIAVAIFDHPQNVGYPTYWHARGYGLFSANPLGQKVFSKGKEELNFALDPGESTTFRHRLFIRSGETTAEQVEAQYKEFVALEK